MVYLHRWTPPSNTLLVTALRVNDTYEDLATGVRVGVASITGQTAVVNLDGYSASDCVAASPVLAVSPVTALSVSPLCAQVQTLAFEVGAHGVCVVRGAASVVPLVVC